MMGYDDASNIASKYELNTLTLPVPSSPLLLRRAEFVMCWSCSGGFVKLLPLAAFKTCVGGHIKSIGL
eukprot:2524419-Amphidinium_carterae.1